MNSSTSSPILVLDLTNDDTSAETVKISEKTPNKTLAQSLLPLLSSQADSFVPLSKPFPPPSPGNKRTASCLTHEVNKRTASCLTHEGVRNMPSLETPPSSALGLSRTPPIAPPRVSATKKPRKADLPHVLIWVCSAGRYQSGWTMKNPKVIGIYGSKAEAQAKKAQIMEKYDNCGHGDIMVGGSWEDEIDLLIRPAEECTI